MPHVVYGWKNNKVIFDIIRAEFNEEEQDKLNKLLNHKTVLDYYPSTSSYWFNLVLAKEYEQYLQDVKNGKKDAKFKSVYKKFGIKFGPYHKMRLLQKYIDRINYKYAVNLNVSFYRYKQWCNFILFFDNFNNYNPRQDISMQQIRSWFHNWNRLQEQSEWKIEPSLMCL